MSTYLVILQSVDNIKKFKDSVDLKELKKQYPWLNFLLHTKQKNINLEYISELAAMSKNPVLDYVRRTLLILDTYKESLPAQVFTSIQKVLIWSEVSKCGSPSQRKQWLKSGYNIHIHNIGSAQIFSSYHDIKTDETNYIDYILIKTHGLIGQYIRGEVSIQENKPLSELLSKQLISLEVLTTILKVLNHCIIAAVSESLWQSTSNEIDRVIYKIVQNDYSEAYSNHLVARLQKLRKQSILHGENFHHEYKLISDNHHLENVLSKALRSCSLWYVEAALQDFSFSEFVKILLLATSPLKSDTKSHLDFSLLMKDLYYDHNGSKKVNLFKKRIFEKYLSEYSFDAILAHHCINNIHVKHVVEQSAHHANTYFFHFQFSHVTEKLIAFCVEAERAELHFEKAILLLYDYFDLRRDQFDRFHNEAQYLDSMNQNIDSKKIILNYIVGQTVVDIGPGGGALLDEILLRYPKARAIGIDFSKNVVEALQKRKTVERLNWEVLYGNALELDKYIKEPVDTIIFCSIIHELYSYIEWNGAQFNHDVIRQALKSAYATLSKGGRIIIRDGIMSEPKDAKRIIRFNAAEGIDFVKRYTNDFKGRAIQYELIGRNEVKMSINDAMEMLYTYTWGEESYIHEVQEQFGYFTPSEYVQFIHDCLGDEAKVIECKHYLQEGYAISLAPKIEFFDEAYTPVPLPDSTSLIVIEKT